MSDFDVRQQRQLGSAGEYAAHFLSVFGDEPLKLDSVGHPLAKGKDLSSQVQAWLSEISPGTRINITSHSDLDIVQLQYSFETRTEVTDTYRATNVGFGLTYVLPVIICLLAAQPGALVIIENPEAHLHPSGQRKMGELLARAADGGVQVVVETHSDHVLNGIRLAARNGTVDPRTVSLHFFARIETSDTIRLRVSTPVLDSSGRIDSWPDGFFDEWDNSLAQLLVPPKS